jgi:hypothetical protein
MANFITQPFDMIKSFMDPGAGYGDAMKEMQEYFEQAQQYQQPFAQAGQGQIPQLQGAQNALMDPATLQSQWSQGYETSPYAQQLMGKATDIGNEEAASMGLGGSSAALSNVQNTSTGIMNQDRQQYMQDLMQKYMSGVGIGQNMFNTGAGAAANMGQNSMNMGRDMGGLRFGQTNAPGQQLGQLIGAGARMYAGGGAGGVK